MNNEKCFCGCETFNIEIENGEHKKNRPIIICERCKCRRRIISPRVSVEVYDVSIPFKGEQG